MLTRAAYMKPPWEFELREIELPDKIETAMMTNRDNKAAAIKIVVMP